MDGETLETLWSLLDEVSGLTQAMSITHRQEFLDACINDSNWQKIIWIGRNVLCMYVIIQLILFSVDSLCRKWTQAKQVVSEIKPTFEQLTNCLDSSLVQEWTRQESIAMENHGDDLKIYEVTSEKCRKFHWADSG